ncbi:MAG TPA: hypothetical protein VMW35_12095 [Myxococcota bacterium]|jgi:hypothetical protein|nr:hypothetical protein [Myxococcota bacterium]
MGLALIGLREEPDSASGDHHEDTGERQDAHVLDRADAEIAPGGADTRAGAASAAMASAEASGCVLGNVR